MKNLKKYNESIKDFLKPKSVEDIKKISDKLSLIENLQKGSEIGSLYMVKKAIDRGINPSMDNNRAIRMACKFGHYDIVKFLLKDERVNPSDDLGSGFSWACRNGHIEIVKLLLTDDRIYNKIYLKDIAIKWAFMTNQIDIIKLILKDKRVEKIITDERIKKILLEDFQRNQMNESIKDYLKPKSTEDVKKIIEKLPPYQKLETIKKYGMMKFGDSKYGVFTKDDIKEILVQWEFSINKLEYIFINKFDRLFSNDEIKDLIKQLFNSNETSYRKYQFINTYNLKQFCSDSDIYNMVKHIEQPPIKLQAAIKYNYPDIFDDTIHEAVSGYHINLKLYLETSIKENLFEIFKIIINSKKIDLSYNQNFLLLLSTELERYDMIKILMEDKNVDPSDRDNSAFFKSIINKKYEIAKLLFTDQRVKDKLSPKQLKYYEKKFNILNESIKDYLKPKSEEDIKKLLEGLPKEIAYLKMLQYDMNNNILSDLKHNINYFKINYNDYHSLHNVRTKIFFNALQKQSIDNLINKNNTVNEYRYITPNLESIHGEVFCLEIREKDRKYIIDKYLNYILVCHEKIDRYKEYIICPTLEQLLQFMDDYMITARKMG